MVHPRITQVSILLLLAIPGQAQKLKYSLTWDHAINVVPATVSYLDTMREGFSFQVFETNAREVSHMWRDQVSKKAAVFVNADPMVANGTRFEQLSADPLTVIASVKDDKGSKSTKFNIAFIPSTGTTPPSAAMQEMFVRELAVDLNRKVVQRQIDEQEKLLGRADDKAAKSKGKQDKLNSSINKKKGELDKSRASRTKAEARNARIKSEIVGYEQKFTLSNEPKDLKKLTKARTELAKGEEKVAGMMEKEVKLQNELNKLADDLPDAAERKEADSQRMSEQQRLVDSLRNKLQNIH